MSAGATRPFVLGVDFGGTKVALATAGSRGEILERNRFEIEAGLEDGNYVPRGLSSQT